MKKPFSSLALATSLLLFSGCQNGSVQLHDHVQQDLQSLGSAASEQVEAGVRLHEHVESDLRRWREEGTFHVRLHDHVHQHLRFLREENLNIRPHDHVVQHLERITPKREPEGQ